MKKKACNFIRICMIIVFCGLLCVLAHGEEKPEDPVRTAASGIVRVRSVCLNDNDPVDVRERSGFLVGPLGSEPYVVTTAEDLEYSSEDLRKIALKLKLDENNNRLTTKLSIVFQGDFEIEASLIDSTDQKNLAILHLGQSLTDKYTLKISDSEAVKGQNVRLLGFPFHTKEPIVNYSQNTVRIEEGQVLDNMRDEQSDTKYFRCSIKADEGCLGGAIIDQDGTVLGMYSIKEENASIAISSAEIRHLMEMHNIKYATKEPEADEGHSSWIYILGGAILLELSIFFMQLTSLKKLQNLTQTGEIKKKLGKIKARLLYIARKETIPITSPMFVIGSMKEKTNYTIQGNNRVSRVHAMICTEKKKYYLEDLHSRNGTFLNGSIITPGVRIPLEDKSEISIAGEKLIFRSK